MFSIILVLLALLANKTFQVNLWEYLTAPSKFLLFSYETHCSNIYESQLRMCLLAQDMQSEAY